MFFYWYFAGFISCSSKPCLIWKLIFLSLILIELLSLFLKICMILFWCSQVWWKNAFIWKLFIHISNLFYFVFLFNLIFYVTFKCYLYYYLYIVQCFEILYVKHFKEINIIIIIIRVQRGGGTGPCRESKLYVKLIGLKKSPRMMVIFHLSWIDVVLKNPNFCLEKVLKK